MVVAPVGFAKDEKEMSPILKALDAYPNIFVRNLDISKLAANTPVEKWFSNRTLFETSIYPLTHLSDFLRFLLVYKFGGTYFDMDVISLQSVESMEPNFFAKEDGVTTGSAVLNFAPNGIGHEMASIVLQ